MTCRNPELQHACFYPSDGSTPVTVSHVTVFNEKGAPHATYYKDDTGQEIDPATYLGGGVASLGECELETVERCYQDGCTTITLEHYLHYNCTDEVICKSRVLASSDNDAHTVGDYVSDITGFDEIDCNAQRQYVLTDAITITSDYEVPAGIYGLHLVNTSATDIDVRVNEFPVEAGEIYGGRYSQNNDTAITAAPINITVPAGASAVVQWHEPASVPCFPNQAYVDVYGGAITITPDEFNELCIGGTYSFANENDVTVVDNGDGTFTATSTACPGLGTFDIVLTCGDGSQHTSTQSIQYTDELVRFPLFEVVDEGSFTFVQQNNLAAPVTLYFPDGGSIVAPSVSTVTYVPTALMSGTIEMEVVGCAAFIRILSQNNEITTMYTEYAGLNSIATLTLDGNNLDDISFLSNLTNITYLGLAVNNITDLSVLSDLDELATLFIYNNNIADLSPLAALDLITLYANNNDIVDISPLSGMENISLLSMPGNDIVDLSALGTNHPSLTQLFLNNNDIVDISIVSNYTSLAGFHAGSNEIVDISPLSALATTLSIVNVVNNNIVDPTPLSVLANLYLLSISGNPLNQGNTNWLSPLTLLERLEISSTNTNDLSGLSTLTLLEILYADSNLVASLSGIENLPLVQVRISTNSITDATILNNLSTLELLYMQNNTLNQPSVDYILAGLVAGGFAGGRLDLRLGANVSPSATGDADRLTLEGNGWRNAINNVPLTN